MPNVVPIRSGAELAVLPSKAISVVVVVYMTGPALFKCIDRVLADPAVGDLVIVDNGSNDDDRARLFEINRREERVKLLHGHGNIGFARGANLGASAAKGRFLIFLNPDAYLEPGATQALIEAAAGRPSPCVIGARILNQDGTEQRGARRREVTPWTTLLSFTQLAEWIPALRKWEIHRQQDPLPDDVMETPVISGACFAMSRTDFQLLRGFDQKYFLHVEDIDLCWRARQMGGSVVFQPKASVIHLGHTSLVQPTFVEYHKGFGLARFFIKRAETWPRRLMAYGLSPLIIAASVSRPLLRRFSGRA